MLKRIVKFIVKSTNQHGVHSPFVFQLVTKCFYVKSPKNIRENIKEYRKELLGNKTHLSVNDLGNGSKVLKTNQRKVADIAKNAGSSLKYATLLNRLVAYLNVKNVLELGTSLGVSSYGITYANNVVLDTVEGCKETLHVAESNFKKFDVLPKINCHQGDFTKIIANIPPSKKYDLIFFDGNHQKLPTLQYFENCLLHKHNDSVFVFDDIYWSKEMTEAWEIIKNHEQVTVTVDIFKWGLVFFRKEQQKEHFKIRF